MTDALIYDVASPKLPMKLEGRNVVGAGGFGRCGEISKMETIPTRMDLGHPSPVSLAIENSFYTARGILRWPSAVRPVLRVICQSKVFSSAVKSVVVDMVNRFIVGSKKKRVQENSSPSFVLRDISPDVRVGRRLVNKPLEAARHVFVCIVDQCKLALR